MRQILLPITIVAVFAVMLFSSCTISVKDKETIKLTGETVKKSRKCEKFDKIKTEGSGKIIYIEDDSCYVVIECDKAVEPIITTEVKDSLLTIAFKKKNSDTEMIGERSYDKENRTFTIHGMKSVVNGNMSNITTIFVHAPRLNGIKSAGYLNLEADKIHSDSVFTLKTSGSSCVDIDLLQCTAAIIHTSGASHIDADIEASESMEIKTDGSSYLDIECINCGDVTINTSGSCSGKIKGDVESFIKSFSGAMSLDTDGLRTRILTDVRFGS